MYSVGGYGAMISDRVRMNAYIAALRKAISPESVVVDIGCGTGIFSLLACQFGARKVYAIEPDDAIQIARESAADSGYADRIVFIQDISTRTTLPERADVIISDLRGVLPMFQQHIPSIIDARLRLLAPNGIMIPQVDRLWIAPVEDEAIYRDHISPWDEFCYELNLQAAKRIVTNTLYKTKLAPQQFLAQPQCWDELDYSNIESPHVKADISWTADKAGIFHGLCAWFDATLMDGISFSNRPGEPELIYGQAFFPLSNPVSLSPGDTINLSLLANLTGDDYTWNWNTLVLAQGDIDREKASYKQSTFFGGPLSLEQLHKQGSDYKPTINTEGKITQRTLAFMDSETPLDQIARELLTIFPGYFTTYNDAFAYAGELSRKYSR